MLSSSLLFRVRTNSRRRFCCCLFVYSWIMWHLQCDRLYKSIGQVTYTQITKKIQVSHLVCAASSIVPIVIIMHGCCSFPHLLSSWMPVRCMFRCCSWCCCCCSCFIFSLFTISLLIELCWLSFYYFDTKRQKWEKHDENRINEMHHWQSCVCEWVCFFPGPCFGNQTEKNRKEEEEKKDQRRQNNNMRIQISSAYEL